MYFNTENAKHFSYRGNMTTVTLVNVSSANLSKNSDGTWTLDIIGYKNGVTLEQTFTSIILSKEVQNSLIKQVETLIPKKEIVND